MTLLSPIGQAFHTIWPHAHDPQSQDYATVDRIREHGQRFKECSDKQLKVFTDQLRRAAADPITDQIVPAFALVNEAAQRTLGIRYYDVQLLAGMALAHGAIAEMQTGEGKTFVAALPSFLFALCGQGVRVMTVNAYLAERDCEQLEPLYDLLGMSIGCLKRESSPEEKRCAYACDITYGPGYEFGFDYLRDQVVLMTRQRDRAGDTFRRLLHGEELPEHQPMQRGHAFAIVDEIDSVLIDEASSPLILAAGSGQPAAHPEVYVQAMQVADSLVAAADYLVDAAKHSIQLSTEGAQKVSVALEQLGGQTLRRPWNTYVEQALRARQMLTKDVDYIVDDKLVVLVDETTGRIFPDRSLRDGLHQAVEAKEGVPITAEQDPLARIPRQRYIRLYDVACGMTGTASGSDRELWEFYRLNVVRIPLRKESRRVTLPPRFFGTEQAKWDAIVQEIQRIYQTGQPTLVGTRTIENSLKVAQRLDEGRVTYRLLNGVQDADEAAIVSRAGEVGAITIATNMAGRGTDIKLAEGVEELGGLHVIATEANDSPRIDRQLVGRCARQGDPGSCQLFVSAEDRLIAEQAPGLAARMQRMANENGEIEEDLSVAISQVQGRVERKGYAGRRQLFAHDAWLDGVMSTLAKETADGVRS